MLSSNVRMSKERQDKQKKTDRQTNWHLNLTFRVNCEGQLSQFLRCFLRRCSLSGWGKKIMSQIGNSKNSDRGITDWCQSEERHCFWENLWFDIITPSLSIVMTFFIIQSLPFFLMFCVVHFYSRTQYVPQLDIIVWREIINKSW